MGGREGQAVRAAAEVDEIDAVLERLLDDVRPSAPADEAEEDSEEQSQPAGGMRLIGLACYFLSAVVVIWLVVDAIRR